MSKIHAFAARRRAYAFGSAALTATGVSGAVPTCVEIEFMPNPFAAPDSTETGSKDRPSASLIVTRCPGYLDGCCFSRAPKMCGAAMQLGQLGSSRAGWSERHPHVDHRRIE